MYVCLFVFCRYGEKAQLLMTDTDSLVYHIETKDVYADVLADLDSYDTSDYPSSHPAFSTRNKKVLGKMKDEYNGRPIAEFVGLRPKMYSILEADGHEKKKAKGISKRTTSRMLHSSYREALFGETSSTAIMQRITSKNQRVYTVRLEKVGLSPYDDKRYVLEDKVGTLAYGHHRIANVRARPGTLPLLPSPPFPSPSGGGKERVG